MAVAVEMQEEDDDQDQKLINEGERPFATTTVGVS